MLKLNSTIKEEGPTVCLPAGAAAAAAVAGLFCYFRFFPRFARRAQCTTLQPREVGGGEGGCIYNNRNPPPDRLCFPAG